MLGVKVDNDLAQRVREAISSAKFLDENALLFQQTNEKIACKIDKVAVVVLSCKDILEAKRKREEKGAKVEASQGQRPSKRK